MIVISMLALAGCPTTDWEQGILDSHNTWRAATSPPAKDMHLIRWDTNIQANMAAHLSTCDSQWPHSDQNTQRKDVGGYEFLGENLAYCAGTGCDAKLASGTPGYIGKGWWDEKDDYNYATDSSSGITSHYTQMASSNIYAMGCVAQKCPGPGPYNWQGEWWWFGCQYGERGRGYWSGTKPFDEGTGGLIEPDATVFTKNPGLCKDAGTDVTTAPATSPAVTVTSTPSARIPTRTPVTLAPVTAVTSTPVSTRTSIPSVVISDTAAPGTVRTPSPSGVLTAAESESGDDDDDDGTFPWLPFVLGGVFLLLCSFVAAWFFITRAAKPTLKVNELLEEGLDEDMPKQDNDHFSL